MPKNNTHTLSLTASYVDADGIVALGFSTGVANLSITGVLTSGGKYTGDVMRLIAIASTGDESADTYNLWGTDLFGNTVTDSVPGATDGTVYTARYFYTVSRVAVTSALTSTNVTVGPANRAALPWIVAPGHYGPISNLGVHYENVSGAVGSTLQLTLQNILPDEVLKVAAQPLSFNHASIAAATQTMAGSVTGVVQGFRLIVTGHSTTATVRIHTFHNGH